MKMTSKKWRRPQKNEDDLKKIKHEDNIKKIKNENDLNIKIKNEDNLKKKLKNKTTSIKNGCDIIVN